MLDMYAMTGEYVAARKNFESMPTHDIAAWYALISPYEQNAKPEEALATFNKLQMSKTVKADEVTLASTLSACAELGSMELGVWIHVCIKRQGIAFNCHLTTSLINTYSKCGDMDKAIEVFHLAVKRDVFVWSSMIGGLAMHGRGRDAIDLFAKMQEAKVKPSDVTFSNVLCACSHSGLVEDGRDFFEKMELVYDVSPGVEHYGSMVDILGRAGFLEEAMELIRKMRISPSASIWGALLGACLLHTNEYLVEQACRNLVELEPRNHGAYVLMSNIYAKLGKWDKVSVLRNGMRELQIKKEPGCSSTEVDGVGHEFLVGDNSHLLSEKIYVKSDKSSSWLKLVGYMPNKSQILQLIEEEDMKEKALELHSEKLAFAFGLISASQYQLIRVMKNLHICGDCHSFAKPVSKLYNREIVLRDRHWCHHFKQGDCSCMDYW